MCLELSINIHNDAKKAMLNSKFVHVNIHILHNVILVIQKYNNCLFFKFILYTLEKPFDYFI